MIYFVMGSSFRVGVTGKDPDATAKIAHLAVVGLRISP